MAQARNIWSILSEPTGKLLPYYQPIIALDTQRIMGYEALGRMHTSRGVRSLGPFFEDKTVSMAEHIRVDRLLRELAMRSFSENGGLLEDAKLFVNLKPSWIYQTYAETGQLPTLQMMNKYGIKPERVVIEITEEAFMEPMENLRAVVDVYRKHGCLIAVDDVGSGFSNLDRIAQLQPNLLKIDIHMLKRSERHSGYYAVLRSFSTLADQIGASLLVEGVETDQDLQRAIEIGARYVQGYLFAPAEPEFREALSFSRVIEAGLKKRRMWMMHIERYWHAKADQLLAAVEADWRSCTAMGADDGEEADRMIEQLLPDLDSSAIRVYMCREDGVQLSSNYRREAMGVWCREPQYGGLNWSWRPYFVPTSVKLEGAPRAVVSQTYTDLHSSDRIRTLSVPVNGCGILFVDMTDVDSELEVRS